MPRYRIIRLVIGIVLAASCASPRVRSTQHLERLDAALVLDNGVYRLAGTPFDGTLVTRYAGGAVKERATYVRGQRHGLSSTFYATGTPRDERVYAHGKARGLHLGWWPSGLRRFEFRYDDDRREGVQRQWYVTGAPYTELTFHADQEDGMQRAFRPNGKPYINYEVKDGRAYGLRKTALCASLTDEVAR